jgi:hypothetical protein
MSTKENVLTALAGYDLEEVRPNHYRLNSPLRAGSNSHAFTLTFNDDEHGAFYDHVSGDKGSLYDLAKLLDIEIPRHAVTDTKRAYTGLTDYAQAHGISPETLVKFGWTETMFANRRALSFPTHTGKRWRFLDADKPYYISEKGYVRSWYGLTASTLKAVASGLPLVICNGEISVIAGQSHNLPAACITAGEKAIPLELLNALQLFLGDLSPEIIIALDCDKAGRLAAGQMASQLVAAGYNAHAVDLSLGNKGDLSDFCMLHKENALAVLMSLPPVQQEVVTSRHAKRLYHADELVTLPPLRWIIEKEVPADGLTMVFGASGAGKSFVALDYALRIAQELPVVYLAAEGQAGFYQRVESWKKHHNQKAGQLYFYLEAVALMDDLEFAELMSLIKPVSPQIVIVDTVARAMVGSDENSTRDMGLFVRACNKIMDALGCAVMLIHHSGKQGLIERGNSSLRAAADCVIKVSQEDDLICISSSKTKDATPFESRYMRLLPMEFPLGNELISSAVLVQADRVKQMAGDRLSPNKSMILSFLGLSIYEQGAKWKDLSDGSGVPAGSLPRALSDLKKVGLIQQNGEYYLLTPLGEERLHNHNHPQSPIVHTITDDTKSDSDDCSDCTDSSDCDSGQQNRLFGSPPNTYYENGG